MKTRPLLALAITTALLVSGCGVDAPTSTGPTPAAPSTSASTSDEVAHSAEAVDIGDRSLWLECWGEPVDGEPTVLLISGQGPTVSYWEPMASDYAGAGHHVCGYDRSGVGGSEFAPEARRTTDDQVTELVALLDAAGLSDPLVVVAHSLGSLPALGLVHEAPERVVGTVLVDPWSPRVSIATRAALPPRSPDESPDLAEERRFLTDVMRDPSQNPEHLLLVACDDEAVALLDEPGPLFGDQPVVVLQAPLPERPAGLPRAYDAVARAAWVAGNEEYAAESTRGRVVEVADTGHDIHTDQPQVVMEAIDEVLTGSGER
jgi:pimeloyl-ACP methyl ester carboxylesterase